MSKIDIVRQEILTKIPITYNPYFHAIIPSVIGLGLIISSIISISHFGWNLLTIPITIFGLFGFEWLVHRYVLHHPQFGLKELFVKHEQMHHLIYTHQQMSMKSPQELYLILMPPYAIVLVFLLLLPLILLLTSIASFNVAMLMLATSMFFFLTYEWLHFSYHLPEGHWIAKTKIISSLRKLHTSHHNFHNMKKWNFNVTFPVFDRILGTYRKE